jgi:hypothetical protein
LLDTLSDLLSELFASQPIASQLPVIALALPDRDQPSLAALIRAAHQRAAHTLSKQHPDFGVPTIRIIETGHEAMMLHIWAPLTTNMELPGAVIIAGEDHSQSSESANCVLTVLLLTRESLDNALVTLESLGDDCIDNMTPFWERKFARGLALPLARLPKHWRDQLCKTPKLATWHRTSASRTDSANSARQRVDIATNMILNAAMDGGLFEPGFTDADPGKPDDSPKPLPPVSCGWVVHNAGNIASRGERVAQLFAALYPLQLELHPLDQATSLGYAFGDFVANGRCLQLALAVERAAHLRQAVLNVVFDQTGMQTCFITPAT